MKEEDIIARIKSQYPDAEVTLEDADCNFEVTIVAQAFSDMGLLQRQKSILGLFKDEIASGELHALSIKANPPSV